MTDPNWRTDLATLHTKIGNRAYLRVALSVGDKRNGIYIPVTITQAAYRFGNVRAYVETDFDPKQSMWVNADRLKDTVSEPEPEPEPAPEVEPDVRARPEEPA